MKLEYGPLQEDRFGLGWARSVKAGEVEYRVSVKPGKRVRLAYSKKYGYHWYATVYRIGGGEVASMPCTKTSGVRAIIEEALHREFQTLAYGKLFAGMSIEDAMYDRAFPRGFNRGENSPECVAYKALRAAYMERK